MARSGPDPRAQENSSDMIDKDISFAQRDMHKSWPMIKGCGMLILGVIVFVFLTMYVFKHFF
jgi:hypothetical protein